MVSRICTKCLIEKSVSDFYKKKNGYQSWCKACTLKRQKKRWKDRKRRAVELTGGKCCRCEYNRNLAALEFHHLDPSKKEMSWDKLQQRSWDKIVEELKKCILLCSNCHSEEHWPDSFLISDNMLDNTLLNNDGLKPTGECPVCKDDVYGTKFCSKKCSGINRRKVKRPNSKTLERMIANMSWIAIGREYGVSDNSVRKWAKYYGLI
jgi:hypothetical protein